MAAVPGPLSLARRLARRPMPQTLPVSAPPALLEFRRHGALPLVAGDPDARVLRIAVVIPSFRRGSGGHSTIADLVRGLEAAGHTCSLWVDDLEGRHAGESSSGLRQTFHEFFGELRGAFHAGFSAWTGADVCVATGWQTVHRTLRLPDCVARAYLVQDHEPEFYATSAERVWAEETYRLGLHCVAASPWLAAMVRDLYGATSDHFDLGVDHATYAPRDVHRKPDRVLFYARAVTPRRAVPLGLLALAELHRRRPGGDIVLYGDTTPVEAPFPHRHLGVLDAPDLATAYAEASVGLVLSTTNPSLVGQEMLACGLPCVELASASMRESFGMDGPFELASLDPLALADAIERLLDDPELRERRSRDGIAFVAQRTWERAAAQVEAGLLAAIGHAARGTP
jgi:glycosyltransferase involved in cell wall biosynthesis